MTEAPLPLSAPDRVRAALDRAVCGRLLLEHPFYRRWEAGELTAPELAAYAEQYRHVERALPAVLGAVVDGLPDGAARRLVAANLAEEMGVPEPHAALFELFASAAGALPDAPATAATAALVDLQLSAARADAAAGLAAVAAYEVQAAAIATTKAAGLAGHYGMGPDGTRFWDVHAAMEEAHASWSIDALASLGADGERVEAPAAAAAAAWWAFLDDRQASAPIAA